MIFLYICSAAAGNYNCFKGKHSMLFFFKKFSVVVNIKLQIDMAKEYMELTFLIFSFFWGRVIYVVLDVPELVL